MKTYDTHFLWLSSELGRSMGPKMGNDEDASTWVNMELH